MTCIKTKNAIHCYFPLGPFPLVTGACEICNEIIDDPSFTPPNEEQSMGRFTNSDLSASEAAKFERELNHIHSFVFDRYDNYLTFVQIFACSCGYEMRVNVNNGFASFTS